MFIVSGEEIISQEPYVCVPNNSPVESRCDRCFASINLKKCSACKVAWYCSSVCQVYKTDEVFFVPFPQFYAPLNLTNCKT